MTGVSRPGPPHGWAVRAAATVTAAMALAACGVQPQPAPEPVPEDRLARTMPEAGSSTPAVRGRIWGVREQRVVPVVVSLPDDTVQTRLQALVALGDAGQPPGTAVVRGTRVVSVVERGRLVVVTLSADFGRASARDAPLALAQVVLTVTEQRRQDQVEVRAGGTTVAFVDERGTPVSRPLGRTDVESLVEGGRAD
jgi:hypothetical protein